MTYIQTVTLYYDRCIWILQWGFYDHPLVCYMSRTLAQQFVYYPSTTLVKVELRMWHNASYLAMQ